MKICYLANNAIPANVASALQIVKMCEAFSSTGNEVLLICPGTKKIDENIFDYYDVKKKFLVKKLSSFRKFPLGLKYYLFSIISIISSLRFKADIYITRNFFTSFLLTIFGKKNILELHHGIEIESRIVRFISRYTNFFNYKSLVRLVAITNSVKDYYKKKYKIKEDKFLVSPSGTSIRKNNFKFFFNNKKLNIGYFGNINKSRGVDIIVKLANMDKKNNYYIYGELSNYKNLKINCSNNLFINNYIPYKKISEAISKMDILIMPYTKKITSTGNVGDITKFTSPLKLFDYLANGKVIICSNITVLKEILKENKNAIFVKNFDKTSAWKTEIEKIKKDEKKRLIISKNNFKLGKIYHHKPRAINILKDL